MHKNFLIFFLFLSLIVSQINSDRLLDVDGDFRYLKLHLDYNAINKSAFMLDKYYPNHFIDYKIHSLNISGTMNEPIFQMIPSDIFFDINETGKISQLSYKENKSSEYFDTKIALKVDLHDNLKFLGFVESKSLENNINQNYLFNVLKNTKKGKLGISYLYHYDNAPIEYLDDNLPDNCQVQNYYGLYFQGDNINPNCAYDSFEKTNESYVIGLDYLYQNNNVSWKHLSSFQVSNTSKEFSSNYDLNYDNKYSWHQNDLIYDINKNNSIYYNQKTKKTFIDNYSDLDSIDVKQDLHALGWIYSINKIKIDFNYNYSSYSHMPVSDYRESFGSVLSYSYSNYNLHIGSDYDLKSNFHQKDDDISLIHSYLSKNFIFLEYNNNFITANFDFGNIDVDYLNESHPFFNAYNSFKYDYFIFSSKIDWKNVKFNFNYSFYDTELTYLNQYADLSISYSPVIKEVRYKPFGMFSVNSMVINSFYDLNLTSSNLLEYVENGMNLDDRRVTSLKAQIGLLFENFRISYEMMNPFKERYNDSTQYSDNILPQLGGFSKINIIWIFKD